MNSGSSRIISYTRRYTRNDDIIGGPAPPSGGFILPGPPFLKSHPWRNLERRAIYFRKDFTLNELKIKFPRKKREDENGKIDSGQR